MTTLSTWCLIAYLTSVDGVTWRPEDYNANKMVKCIKGEAINGTFNVRTGGNWRAFGEQNRDEFVTLACRASAKKLLDLIEGRFTIVPVPNSSAVLSGVGDFRTLQIARRVAEFSEGRAKVVPALRWKQIMQSSRRGGTRDPQILFDNLEVCGRTGRPIILFDDVLTTGAHLIACHRKLAAVSMTPKLALAVGRTTHEQRLKVIQWVEEQIIVDEQSTVWPF